MKCTCGDTMENLGNTSGITYASYPPQWDEEHVCHKCKTKQYVRVSGEAFNGGRINTDNYKDITNI